MVTAPGKRGGEAVLGEVRRRSAHGAGISPDGEVWLSENGSVGLATSVSGDTLAGTLTGLVAGGASPALATVWAVYMHRQAGRRLANNIGTLGLLAREIPGEIPQITQELGNDTAS